MLRTRVALSAKSRLFPGVFLRQAQYGHAFRIPGNSHQVPFVANVVQTAGGELAKTHRGFDDPERRFDGSFAQRLDRAAGKGREPVCHALDRTRLGLRGGRLAEAIQPIANNDLSLRSFTDSGINANGLPDFQLALA